MSKEPTTLTSVGKLIAEVLRDHYGVDPVPLFRRVGLDPALMANPNARYPRTKLMALWDAAADATGDPCIGLVVGFALRPTSYHALGYSWMASQNLHEAMDRLSRYYRVIVTVPLPGDNIELVRANDAIVERYLDNLDPQRVATEVRKLLIDLLPTGHANQQIIASRLNRSVSTLQRHLSAAGTTFREIQDSTRRALAEEYVRDGKHSLSQIAYLLGFSDQSNFSRAFKRWSGGTPTEFQSVRTDSLDPP